MRRPLAALLALAACAETAGPGASTHRLDGRPLTVTLEQDFFDPQTVTGTNDDGTIYPIDVFPLIGPVPTVRSADDTPLTETDADLARSAVGDHCALVRPIPVLTGSYRPDNLFIFGPCNYG